MHFRRMSLSSLRASDLRQLIQTGYEMQACDNGADLAHYVQGVLHRAIGADMMVWNELTADGKVSTGMTFPDPGDAFWMQTAPAMFAHIHEHPFVRHLKEHKVSRFTASISDLLPTRCFVETGLYRNAYREFSARHQISSATDTLGGDFLVLSLNRISSDFSSRHKTMLEQITTQARLTYRRLRQIDDLTNRLMAPRGCPSEAESTWLYLDERLIITWGAPGLRAFLGGHFQHATTDLFLPQPLAVLVAEAFSSWRTDQVTLSKRTFTCRLKHGIRSYELQLEGQRKGGYRLVIMLTPGERDGVKGLGIRARLSRREKEAVYWVAKGKTNPEIGVILQISPRTAEKHVHAALAKLGLENRLQLALACQGEP